MTPLDAARQCNRPVNDLGGRFMLAPETYAAGATAGFSGFDFYFGGRGGVLGDVPAKVVAGSMFFFNTQVVTEQWAMARGVMEPRAASDRFAACGAEWGRRHLAGCPELERLADLIERVVDAANPNGLALFAAWLGADRPTDPEGRALHAVHLLRELRGGLHGLAVTAAGLSGLEAVMVSGGEATATFFGYQPPFPDPEPLRARWQSAEQVTDDLMARQLAVLTPVELDDLARLVGQAATHTP